MESNHEIHESLNPSKLNTLTVAFYACLVTLGRYFLIEDTAWNSLYRAIGGVIKLGNAKVSFHAKSSISIDSDSNKLIFIRCAIMAYFEKTFN